MTRVAIVGGGLSGCLAALTLARRRPEVKLVLIEQGEVFGGNHTWSFFDSDIDSEGRGVLEGIKTVRWDAHDVHFPKRSRTIAIGYNSIRSEDLDRTVREVLRPEQYRLEARVQAVSPSSVTLDSETFEADAVIDARGSSAMPGLELGWQKFVGRYYRFAKPHGLSNPVIMDATIEQLDGYRFVYQLPFGRSEMLVEDTYYSTTPLLDQTALRDRIDRFVNAHFSDTNEVLHEESGVLPVVLNGDIGSLWRGEEIPRFGVRGGFFHPTTSYSLPDAAANAALVARQPDFTTAALYAIFRERAERLWRERSFFRLLNRMLFHAAAPDQAYRVLEHFYRLSPSVIARFYAARLSGLDKLRILSGKPPVPVSRALSALRGRAA